MPTFSVYRNFNYLFLGGGVLIEVSLTNYSGDKQKGFSHETILLY